MPKRNLHEKPFDEGTKVKLELYQGYLREWLHVFINNPYVDTLQIFDFFAGPGRDVTGTPGSPVITCDEIRNVLDKCNKRIRLYFNEHAADKYQKLSDCLNAQKPYLAGVAFDIRQDDFHDIFKKWQPLMQGRVANLLFLDQNGVDQITKPIFQSIVKILRTDFLFFISSAMVNRFKKSKKICENLPIEPEDFSSMNGQNVHRILVNAYLRWIPDDVDYFLGAFSIKKGANVYGLVFGSRHPRGIDKFLQVAWKHGGDANFDIDKDGIDPGQPSLFPENDKPTKISEFEQALEQEILNGTLKTNKDLYIFTLRNGMLAVHAREALKMMKKHGKIPKQTHNISYNAWNEGVPTNIQLFAEKKK
jgi:three-Cys-motif partner protein